jgi:hypothetical protein
LTGRKWSKTDFQGKYEFVHFSPPPKLTNLHHIRHQNVGLDEIYRLGPYLQKKWAFWGTKTLGDVSSICRKLAAHLAPMIINRLLLVMFYKVVAQIKRNYFVEHDKARNLH